MATRTLPRKADGSLILPGRVKKTLTWPFMTDTSLPATLAATGTGASATIAVNNQSAGTGSLVLTNATTSSLLIQTAAAINLASFEAVLWEIEGLTNDANTGNGGFGMSGSSGGAYYNYTTGALKLGGGTGTVQLNLDTTAGYTMKRNLGLLILPRIKHVYMLMSDQVIADVDYTGGSGSSGTLTSAAVQPNFYVAAAAGTTTVATIEQLRLTTWSY